MTTLIGIGLVLISLVAFLVTVVALGLPWAAGLCRTTRRGMVIRHALWWGLAVLSILVMLINQFTPLGEPTALVVLALAMIASGLIGIMMMRTTTRQSTSFTRSGALLGAGLLAIILTLSLRALGPVTNYDTGLYHLGAISYAEQFATIPGLANVFFAYGYATSQFPLAAAMTWTPMGLEGYRILNLALLLLAAVDLWMRIQDRNRNPGTWVLAAGLSVVVITMVPLADYWVISPTQDASVFLLTVVSGAYLSEALARNRWLPAASTAVIVATSATLIRTTMLGFLLATVLVLFIWALRTRRAPNRGTWHKPMMLTALVAGAGFVVSGARDYLLSGWWLYPLSVLPFDVAWRAPDPINPRLATLGAARNPEDLWAAAQSWSWIADWFTRATRTWELYALLLTWIVAAIVVLWWKPPRRMWLAILPSAFASMFWFLFTPPSFRFAWGPLFTVGTIALGWATWQHLRRNPKLSLWPITATASVLLLIAAVTVFFRVDLTSQTQDVTARWIPISFEVTPVAQADVAAVALPSGLPALAPIGTDQCWAAFPLCSPQLPETLRLRGATLQQGFLP